MIMIKYLIAKKYNKYLKYYKKCRKLKSKPKPKQSPNRNLSVFDCLPIYYLLIIIYNKRNISIEIFLILHF